MLEFNTVASGMSVSAPTIPVVSNITGDVAGQDFGTADYWLRHVREAVRFADGVRSLSAAGVTRFLELGPASGLTASIGADARAARARHRTRCGVGASQGPFRADHPADRAGRVVGLWRARWAGAACATGGRLRRPSDLRLPTATLLAVGPRGGRRRDRAWAWRHRTRPARRGGRITRIRRRGADRQADHLDAAVARRSRRRWRGAVPRRGLRRAGHPRGRRGRLPRGRGIDAARPAGAAARRRRRSGRGERPRSRPVPVWCRCSRAPDGDGAAWMLHAEGELGTEVSAPGADLSVWPPVGAREVDVTDAYAVLSARGYEYGPAFQGLTSMWRRGDEVFAEVEMSQDLQAGGFGVHPALLDGALHAVVLEPRRRRAGPAVLLAEGVAARLRGVGGAGQDRPDRSVVDVDRPGRRARTAGAVGGRDGGPSGVRTAVGRSGRRRVRWRAVRGRLVAGADGRGAVPRRRRPRARPAHGGSGISVTSTRPRTVALERMQTWLAEPSGVLGRRHAWCRRIAG